MTKTHILAASLRFRTKDKIDANKTEISIPKNRTHMLTSVSTISMTKNCEKLLKMR